MATVGNIEKAAIAPNARGASVASAEPGPTGSKSASMIEQVAEALYLHEHPRGTWDSATCKPPYVSMARAAIDAMPKRQIVTEGDLIALSTHAHAAYRNSGYPSGSTYLQDFQDKIEGMIALMRRS